MTANDDAPDFLRAGEIARMLGLSERTIRRWIADGILPSRRLGGARLVARDELDRLLAAPALPDQIDVHERH